jgi:hypothetical protein
LYGLVSFGHVTLIKKRSFGAEKWLTKQNMKPDKGCVIEKLSPPSSKEYSKDDRGKS